MLEYQHAMHPQQRPAMWLILTCDAITALDGYGIEAAHVGGISLGE